MQQSAERFGAVTELAEVYKASLSGRIKTLDTSEGVFQGRTVVIATGASPRSLGVPGEEALVGKGVHSVSYTHLDVYKRQLWERRKPQNTRPHP